MRPAGNRGAGGNLLWPAGLLSLALAVLHVAMVATGTPAYRYFTAPPRLIQLSEQGSPVPALVTLGIALGFVLWALYGVSGAGLMPRLPLLRTGLAVIGTIYILRGVLLFPQLAARTDPPRSLVFSGVSLAIGMVYLAGLTRSWSRLHVGASDPRGVPGIALAARDWHPSHEPRRSTWPVHPCSLGPSRLSRALTRNMSLLE